MAHESSLLDVKGLRIGFPGPGSDLIEVVKGIDFTIGTETVALVGESGSGKSLTARALMGLVARPGQVTAERLSLAGDD
ncbi:ATP-binding cassette domain-containing protein, partial [Pseudomonas viridiflava]